jgi:hypothetical protein
VNSPGDLLSLALAIVLLFAVVIALGIYWRRRSDVRNLRDITADFVWKRTGEGSPWHRTDLLYGIDQDLSISTVSLIVKDHEDKIVGRLIYPSLSQNMTIETGPGKFVATDQWPTGDVTRKVNLYPLREDNTADQSHLMCSFAKMGRLRGVCLYTVSGKEYEIPFRPGWLTDHWQINRDGAAVGQLWTIGGLTERGRALLAPSDIPLPARLFILGLFLGVKSRIRNR